MQIERTVKKPMHRGTIILDTSMLFQLAHKVPSQFIEPSAISPPATYLDILPFLAKNGFRIVIPEAAAVEGANMLADGTNLSTFFDNSKKQFDVGLKQSFIKAVARGEFENIEIVSDTGPKEVDTYCAALKTAATPTPKALGRSHSLHTTTQHLVAKDIVRAILNVHRNHDREKLSERAILSLLGDPEYAHGNMPVFIVSSNTTLNTAVSDNPLPHIRTVHGLGFVCDFMRSGLATHAGLNSDTSGNAMYDDMIAQQKHSFVPIQPGTLKHTSSTGNPKHISIFERCLTDLNNGIVRETRSRIQAEVDAPKASEPTPAMKRFAQRFGSLGNIQLNESPSNAGRS